MLSSNRLRRSSRALVLGGLAALIVVLPSGAQAATPGNSQNAQACQKGGFENFVTSTGEAFTSEGKCTSYAARGGTLVAASVVAPCLHGGWENYVRSDSTSFGSEQACRAYAAGGGTLTSLTFSQQYQRVCEAVGGTFSAPTTFHGDDGWSCTKFDGIGLTAATADELTNICGAAQPFTIQLFLLDFSLHNYTPNYSAHACSGPQLP